MAISITFDTGGGGGSITLVTPTVIYGTDYFDMRFSQHTLRTGDGEEVTYDGAGKNVVEGDIVMKGVLWSEGDAFRTWVRTKAVYALNKFTITPPSGLDLGLGKGVAIANCNFIGDDDKGVFKHVVPGVFKIKFPYTFVRI